MLGAQPRASGFRSLIVFSVFLEFRGLYGLQQARGIASLTFTAEGGGGVLRLFLRLVKWVADSVSDFQDLRDGRHRKLILKLFDCGPKGPT